MTKDVTTLATNKVSMRIVKSWTPITLRNYLVPQDGCGMEVVEVLKPITIKGVLTW